MLKGGYFLCEKLTYRTELSQSIARVLRRHLHVRSSEFRVHTSQKTSKPTGLVPKNESPGNAGARHHELGLHRCGADTLPTPDMISLAIAAGGCPNPNPNPAPAPTNPHTLTLHPNAILTQADAAASAWTRRSPARPSTHCTPSGWRTRWRARRRTPCWWLATAARVAWWAW